MKPDFNFSSSTDFEKEKIPEGWRIFALKECIELVNGRAYKQTELLESGTPVIRIQNLNGGDSWYFSDLILPEKQYCDNGDLLFAWSGTFGPYIWNGSRSIYHYHIWKMILKSTIDKKFAYFLLTDLTERIKAKSHGGTIVHITKTDMENFQIALPPLPVQRHIVAVLEKVQEVKRRRHEADALTGAFLESVFREMLGDLVKNEKGWNVEKFGNISKINMGQSPPGESYNKEGRGVFLLNGPEEFGTKYPTPKQYTTKPSKICDIGDILFCVRGATAGRMNWSDKNYCIGRGLAAIQSFPGKSEILFLYQFLLMNYDKFQKTGRGSTFINISRADLTDLKIPLPPLALQQQFAIIVESVERLRDQQVASGREIEGLCEGLMQRAFAGELVV